MSSNKNSDNPVEPGSLRIIGGNWRGKKLRFPAVEGLRPTPDRVRETLFNWLMFEIAGARCLDLFAGSGALGLEALSRGAAETVFVDRDRRACGALDRHLFELRCNSGKVICTDSAKWLTTPGLSAAPFNIVFLDPPFDAPILPEIISQLKNNGCLAPNAWLYVEQQHPAKYRLDETIWHNHRTKVAGQVSYQLYQIRL